jgi:hypothetical protein
MVRALQLILDDDSAPVAVLGVDVQAEVADQHLRRDDGQRHPQGVRQHVDVLGQPGREIARLGEPDFPGSAT